MARLNARRRRGGISTATLFALPVLLLVLGMVIYVALARDSRTEAQNGADAAALAAAREMACDDLLVSDRGRLRNRLDRAADRAELLASANFANGRQLSLRRNETNAPDGDVVFGRLADPLGQFHPADLDDLGGEPVNAVRVTLSGGRLRAPLWGNADETVRGRATAMLDWCVVGFRPRDEEAAPVVPLGLFTDDGEKATRGWRASLRGAPDAHRFDPATGRFAAGPDGIPEVAVEIGGSDPRAVPGAFLRLGADSFEESAEQFRSGVKREHCEKMAGGFVLGEDNTLTVHCSTECPRTTTAAHGVLSGVLAELAASGRPRIWPLFSGAADDSDRVRVTGWVGARVVSVAATGNGFRLVLQPAVVYHTSAVTDHRRPARPSFWSANRTVCRVRLAE